MKRIFLILIFINTLNVVSQDCESKAWKFKWGYSDNDRIFQPDTFKQTSIFTGFQWSNTLPMDNALINNCVAEHGMEQVEAGSRVFPSNSINQPTWWDRGNYWIGAYFAPFMQKSEVRNQELGNSPVPSPQSQFQQQQVASETGKSSLK